MYTSSSKPWDFNQTFSISSMLSAPGFQPVRVIHARICLQVMAQQLSSTLLCSAAFCFLFFSSPIPISGGFCHRNSSCIHPRHNILSNDLREGSCHRCPDFSGPCMQQGTCSPPAHPQPYSVHSTMRFTAPACQDNLWHQGCRLVLVHPLERKKKKKVRGWPRTWGAF